MKGVLYVLLWSTNVLSILMPSLCGNELYKNCLQQCVGIGKPSTYAQHKLWRNQLIISEDVFSYNFFIIQYNLLTN